MKTTLLILALSLLSCVAADTNQLRRIGPRNLRQTTNAPVKPAQPPVPAIKLGPRYDVAISPGTGIVIISTNTFTAAEARRWLQEAIRTLK